MSGLSVLQSHLGIVMEHLPGNNSVLGSVFFKDGCFSKAQIKFLQTGIFLYLSGQRVSQSRSGTISSYLINIIRGWMSFQRTGKAHI